MTHSGGACVCIQAVNESSSRVKRLGQVGGGGAPGGTAEGEYANLALDGDRGSEYVCLLVPRDAFDAPCKLRIDPRLNGEVDPPNRALRPAVSLFSSLPCVIFLSQLALSGRVPVPAIAVSESSFTQPNSRRYSN